MQHRFVETKKLSMKGFILIAIFAITLFTFRLIYIKSDMDAIAKGPETKAEFRKRLWFRITMALISIAILLAFYFLLDYVK